MGYKVQESEIMLGMNGVAMARHGLILWENYAMGPENIF